MQVRAVKISRPRRLVVAMVALLPVALISAPAAAEPTNNADPFAATVAPDYMSIMRQQEKLQPVVKVLYDEVLAGDDSGFTSLAFEGGGVSLYWKGALTPGMAKTVSSASSLGKVRVVPSRYTKAELEAAAAKVDAAVGTDSDLQSIQIHYDGSGIVVHRMSAAAVAKLKVKTGHILHSASPTLAALKLNVPMTVSTVDGPIQLLSSRTADSSPWNAGDNIVNPDSPTGTWTCTSGFGINKGGTTYVSTAAHCGTPPEHFYNDGTLMGSAIYEDWDKDIMLLDARAYPWMFDGSPTTSTHKTVYSYGYQIANEYLCQSGETSGTVCGLKTLDWDWTIYGRDSDGDSYHMHGFIRAQQVDGQSGGEHGDSGAPVFSLDGDGVRAKGSLSARDGSNHSIIYFQDIADFIRDWGYPVTE